MHVAGTKPFGITGETRRRFIGRRRGWNLNAAVHRNDDDEDGGSATPLWLFKQHHRRTLERQSRENEQKRLLRRESTPVWLSCGRRYFAARHDACARCWVSARAA